jgi:hypothetical protein
MHKFDEKKGAAYPSSGDEQADLAYQGLNAETAASSGLKGVRRPPRLWALGNDLVYQAILFRFVCR